MLLKGGPARSGMKRGKQEKRPQWACSRGHENPGFATRCLTSGCNERRP